MKTTLLIVALFITSHLTFGACTPLGDETTYGANNVWIGYTYGGASFNRYKGYVNEGAAASASFDESFGGASVNYTTNGCTLLTDTFSVRYKLVKTFADADYIFTVGGDDGYRFSIDGGSTWVINDWSTHAYATTTYTVHLNGTYNLILEYFENFIDNRISFDVVKACSGSGNPAMYGTNNQWIGYVYSGMNFNSYKGNVNEGSALTPNFDESFGGDYVNYGTSDCSVYTEQISIRYRLKTALPNGTYTFTVGGDDGYRLSLDGGATYVINKWGDQSYNTTTYTASLGGSYNMVLEYYENGGGNRVSFSMSGGAVLPITLVNFKGIFTDQQEVDLSWNTMMENDVDHYEIERSGDGMTFQDLLSVPSKMKISTSDYQLQYSTTDAHPLLGTSYYRVKLISKNGTTNQSPVIQINNTNQNQDTKIYPTLIQNNMVFVESDKNLREARMEFFDLSGRKISETYLGSSTGRQTVQVSKSGNLPTGTYLARLTSNGQIVKNQLVIVQSH
jgi:PA14 domain